jgi:hypothetical protein
MLLNIFAFFIYFSEPSRLSKPDFPKRFSNLGRLSTPNLPIKNTKTYLEKIFVPA